MFRTGKITILKEVSFTDRESLVKRSPDLESKVTMSEVFILGGRMDKPELPFKDVRVRRALNLAVNQKEILEDLFDGQGLAVNLAHPAP